MCAAVKAEGNRRILERIAEIDITADLMEVCGTHTMAIAKSGLKSVLPSGIRLLSGPGCPVCVTPDGVIDAVLELSGEKNVIIATYGDMIRVPGSRRGDNLAARRAAGARSEVVYSPMDAISLAQKEPDSQVVFLGAGFETTAPGTAIAIKAASEMGLKNFTVLSMLKQVEPALRALMASPDFSVSGFLCPGHVATIIGEKGFAFLAEEYNMPAVISGFEAEDILISVYKLTKQISEGRARLENEYTRAVRPEGNRSAINIMKEVLETRDDEWRGLGLIPASGLKLKEEYAAFDAEVRFSLNTKSAPPANGCRCGDVLRGRIGPDECPLFGKVCTPEDPVGPCMFSSEGACAAQYKYAQ